MLPASAEQAISGTNPAVLVVSRPSSGNRADGGFFEMDAGTPTQTQKT